MSNASRLLVALLALLFASAAWAQEPNGYLGVDVQDLSKDEADRLGWEAPRGVRVVKPRDNGPAARAGLLAQDVIVSLDGREIENKDRFVASIGAKEPGSKVKLRILRAGREQTITVALERQPTSPTQVKASAKNGPILQLDSGGHMAKIQSVVFTPDGKLLVSASDDKVIRVWDWQKNKTIRTMRGQSGPGPAGKIHAMALSPDGRLLAAAGWSDGPDATVPCCGDIRLYDFKSGEIIALLKGHGSVVNVLNFSPDGTKLVSGSGQGDLSAIIWDVAGRRPLHKLVGHKLDIYAATFTPDGQRVVTGSDDTTLRLWRVSDGSLIKEMTGHTKDIDRGVAVRATDGIIASGDTTGEIRFWDGRTGDFIKVFANQGGPVGKLAFSLDGTRLLSTCRYRGCLQTQFVWDTATGKQLYTYKKHDNIVLAAVMSPDGELVATGGGSNTAIHVWDLKTGTTQHVLAGTGAPGWAAGFSRDGKRLGWGYKWSKDDPAHGYGVIQFAMTLPGPGVNLGRPEPVSAEQAAEFLQASPTHANYALAHRKGGAYGYDALLDVSKDGKTVASIERGPTDGYQHRSYTFTPDGQTVISGGGNGNLTAYDLKGKFIDKFLGHEGDVWSVTPSPDGRLLVSGSADQTIRLWNLNTRELIVTLFQGYDGEWVLWTPQGYYTGSPGSDKLVGWQINKGADKSADFVGAEQLRQHLNRPDIVEKAIMLASAEQAVREAPGTTFVLADLLARPVPRFTITSPPPDSVERRGRSLVRIRIAATPDPVKSIRVQVNGLQVEEKTAEIDSGGFRAGEQLLDVPLARGRNEVRITLTNAIGEKAEMVTLIQEGEGALDKRGTLYILAIGVDKYPGLGESCGQSGTLSCDLNFPSSDARAIADAMEKRLGTAHSGVVKRVLVNGAANPNDQPTAANILDAIDLLKQAKETDTIVFFIAGHGFNDGPNYRFLPTNAELAGGSLRGSTIVSWHTLQEAVETAKGRRILFVDTCHSGNAYNQRLGNAAYHANIIAYTAARFDQEAIEDPKLGHGLFTYAVVEGLRGSGDLAAKRQISTKELGDYVIRRVEQLAKAMQGDQEPQYFKGRDAEDYVLVRW